MNGPTHCPETKTSEEREGCTRTAIELREARGLRALRELLAALNPRVYHALSRLRP